MKIITVNLPVSYLKMLDGLVGENGLYPSRSELVRVAVRDFLIRELEAAKSFGNFSNPAPTVDPNLYVQIPLGSQSNGIPEFKTFRLIKKDVNEAGIKPKSEQKIEQKKESIFKTSTSQNPFLNQKVDSDSMENVEFEDYVEHSDKEFNKHPFSNMNVNRVESQAKPYIPQVLEEPEILNIEGRILRVVKR
jgi:hypothetical protein